MGMVTLNYMTETAKGKGIKITYLVDFFRTTEAGTERQLSHLLRCLSGESFSVQLISLQRSSFLQHEAPDLFPNITITELGAKSDLSRSFTALIRLFLILRQTSPDIVHTFFPGSNSLGILIARLAGVKTLISSRRDMGYNLNKKDVALLKFANRFVSFVVVNSKAVGGRTRELEGFTAERIRVIYNGLPPTHFAEGPKIVSDQKNLPVVAIVANLNRRVKRVDLFINAAFLLHKKFPAVRFWIIGDGPLRKELQELALSLGLADNVMFLGSRSDVPRIMREVMVGVNCSDSEGMSNAIMEYMACGIPVVATDVGGNRELVEDGVTGLLIPKNDPSGLASALASLLRDPCKASKLGSDGHLFMTEKFGISTMLSKTKDVYASALSRTQGDYAGRIENNECRSN